MIRESQVRDCITRGELVALRPGHTVSTPVSWEEVRAGLDPRVFTIHSVPERVAEGGDLWGSAMR